MRAAFCLYAPFFLFACSGAQLRAPSSVETDFFSPSFISRLPEFVRPAGDHWTDDPSMVRLWKKLGAEATDFDSYRFLFPQKFRVARGDEAQGVIDSLALKILQTPSGKRSFCFLASEDKGYLSSYLGVSAGGAAALQKLCGPQNLSPAQKQMFTVMKTVIFKGVPPAQRPKKIAFLFSESGPTPIEGFTTKGNSTIYVLDTPDITEESLLRVFAHELAITFDQFARLAYPNDPTSWETGLPVVFNKPEQLGSDIIFEQPADRNAVRCAIRDPALRYALTTERAFRFEDKLIDELGKTGSSPPVSRHGGCRESVERWLPVFPLIYDTVWYELQDEAYFFETYCGEAVQRGRPQTLEEMGSDSETIVERFRHPDDPARKAFFQRRLGTLEGTTLTFNGTRQTIPLCDLLLSPEVGPHYPDLSGGGPRPRVGGF